MSNRRGWRSGSKPLGRLILILLLAWVIPAFGIVFAIPSPAIAAGDEWNQPIDREWDQAIMPGWGREVQRWYGTYGWDESWPADFDGSIEVTDVAIENQRPAEGVTGDVIFLEKEYANDDETSDDFWWYYEGLNYGGATLRVTYTDPFGVAQSYTFDVIVDSDVYELDAWVEDGSFNALPGATKQLGAWGIHKRQDQPDTQEGLTYQWSIVDGQEFATIEGQGEDATLSLKPYEGDDPFWQEHVQVQVTLFDGGTEVARYDDLHVTVAALYGEIWPVKLDRLNVGESVTITPELRSYAIEHLDTGGYITLPTKDGFSFDGYDDACLSVTDNGNGSITVTRLMPWGTYLPLRCTWVNPEHEDVEIYGGLFLFDLDFDMWLDYERDDLFADGTLDVGIESNGLEGADYELEVTVGDWSGNDWSKTYAPGREYTITDEGITLDGASLSAAGAEHIRVLVRAVVGDVELCWSDMWVDVRDVREEYEREWDTSLLIGWGGTIARDYQVHVESSEYPDGYPGGYQITDVTISGQRPAGDNDGDVVSLEKIDNDQSGAYHWEYRAVGYGEADITASFTDIHGNPQSWTFTVHVGRDVYGVDVWTDNGVRCGLPGTSIDVHAAGWHESEGEVPEGEEFAYDWRLADGCDEWATIQPSASDPATATVTFKQVPEGEEYFRRDIGVDVRLLVGGEERAGGWCNLEVSSDYVELLPLELDHSLGVGEWLTFTPELRHYAVDVDGEYEVIEPDDLQVFYNSREFEVKPQEDGSYKVRRLQPWPVSFDLWASWDDERNSIANTYRFDYMGEWMFTDVHVDTPHANDILWLARYGITTGFKDGTFHGDWNVIRQDMAAFLYRLAGSPTFVPTPEQAAAFVDVDSTNPDVNQRTQHYKEILWLAAAGISEGWPVGPKGSGLREFRGREKVLRQDMAAFLRRLARYKGADASMPDGASNPFYDVDSTNPNENDRTPHYEDIIWLASTGVTTGWDEGNGRKSFRGDWNVVRQDMAAFLHRLNNYIDKNR